MAVNLGKIDPVPSSFVFSTEAETDIIVIEGSASSASLSIDAVNAPSGKTLNDLLRKNADGSYALGPFGNSSAARGVFDGFNVWSLLLLSALGVFSAQNKKGGLSYISLFLIVLALLFTGPTVQSSSGGGNLNYQLTLNIPTNYKFQNLNLTFVGGGSISGSGLSGLANKMSLDLCQNHATDRPLANSFINLDKVSPSATSFICSYGPVNVNIAADAISNAIVEIRSHYSNVSASVTTSSNTKTNVRILQSPRSWTRANGTTVAALSADSACTFMPDTLGHIGSCNFGPNPANIRVNFTGSETSGFSSIQLIGSALKSLCPATRTVGVDWAPEILHGQLDPLVNTPDIVNVLDNSQQWYYRNKWRIINATVVPWVNDDNSTVQVLNFTTGAAWDAMPYWAVAKTGMPVKPANWLGLTWNAEYGVSFLWRQDPVANAAAVGKKMYLMNITITICDLSTVWWQFNDTAAFDDSRCAGYVVIKPTAGQPGWNDTNWLNISDARVKVNRYIDSPFVAIQFGINSINTQQNPPLVFLMKDVKFRSVPKPYPALPNPLTSLSELVDIPLAPVPSSADLARVDSSCPHLKSGLKFWHDPATWGGSLPDPTSVITLPANTSVLITSCSLLPVVYNTINIPVGSELIFDDDNIALHVNSIFVMGRLWIGSETCRVFGPINIVFHGLKSTVLADNTLTKGIQAVGGTIDMHGKQYYATWSRLARTAVPGDDRVTLFEKVNWEYGQQVVIATSIYQDDFNDQNELMTVKAVDSTGKTVQFTSRLKFGHYGGSEYQSEVGLLSRRIVLSSYKPESDADAFGGHVMITPSSESESEGRFSGVETRHMGQQNIIARYPIHFHLVTDCSASYVQDCSFVSNYYRCAVFHGSTLARWSRNVAYNTTGHCYYIESGIEENNTIEFNLAVKTSSIGTPMAGDSQGGDLRLEGVGLRQPADGAAAGFYITNSWNSFTGNAASGGWSGFSFPGLGLALFGAQTDPNFAPNKRPIKLWHGNSAHSSGYYWGGGGSCIYIGGNLTEDPSNSYSLIYNSGRISRPTVWPNNTPAWMRFNDTKMFLCQNGLMHWGDRVELVNVEAHDVVRSATVFGEAWMSNTIVNGKSNNPFVSNFPNHQGNQFYDTYVKTVLTRMKYRNMQPNPSTTNPQQNNQCLISMTHSDVFKPQGISATRAWTYTNVNSSSVFGHGIQDTGSSRYFNFIDWDGSAVQRPGTGSYIVGSHIDWWYLDSSCWKNWLVWICPQTSGRYIGFLDIRIPGLIDDSQQDPSSYIGNMYLFGSTPADNRSSIITRNHGVTGVTGKTGWYMHLYNGSPSQFDIYTGIIPDGSYIPFAIRYPTGTTFTITTNYVWWSGSPLNQPVNQTDSIANVMASPTGRLYYFDGNLLYLKLVIPASYYSKSDVTTSYFERDGVRIWNVNNGYKYSIRTSCGGAGTYCAVQDPLVPSSLP